MRVATALLILLLPTLAAGSTPVPEGDRYMVEMELWIDGEERGTPIVVVAPHESTAVEVDDTDGDSGWKIELLVEPPAAEEVAPQGAIWLNITVYEKSDGDWELLADSLLGVPEGRTGTMSVVESGQESATPEDSRVYLAARSSLLRPGEAED